MESIKTIERKIKILNKSVLDIINQELSLHAKYDVSSGDIEIKKEDIVIYTQYKAISDYLTACYNDNSVSLLKELKCVYIQGYCVSNDGKEIKLSLDVLKGIKNIINQ